MRRLIVPAIIILLLLTFLPQQAQSDFSQSKDKTTSNKGPMNSPWPMYRRDMRHTGRSPYGKAGCTGVLKWKVKIGWLISSSPAIDKEGTIYIGSDNCKLYAIYPNGTIKWTVKLGDFVDSSPALAEDGTIYVGCDDGYLYAVNPDGTIKWKKRVGEGSYIFSSPLIDENGIIYIGTTGIKGKGTFAAFYPDGTVKWEASIKTASPPAKYGDTIYVPGNDGYLYAVCAENGTVKWKYKVGCYSRTTGVSIGDDGTIYFSSFDYKCLYAFYPNGTLRWKKKITYSYISPAIGEDGTLYVATASGWGDDYVYAFSPNGTILWKCKTVPSGSSGLVIDKYGVIYGGGSLRAIYAVNPNGTMRWFYKINNEDGVIASCPAIGEDGTIYVAAWDGYLYAIEPRDAADLRVSGIYYGPTFGCIRIRVKNVGCEPAYNVTCEAKILVYPWEGDEETKIYTAEVPVIDVGQEVEVKIGKICLSPLKYIPFHVILGPEIHLLKVEAENANHDLVWEGGGFMQMTIIGPLVCLGGLLWWFLDVMGSPRVEGFAGWATMDP